MVVRVWAEQGIEAGMRVRLTAIDDIIVGDEHVRELVIADPSKIAVEVEAWLARWIAAA
jgi:hypothetical protein